MRPLRLVIVARRFWPLVGKTERTLARLAGELAALGYSTTVLTPRWHLRWPAEIRIQDVPVVRLWPPPEGRWRTWRYMRSLTRWLRGHQDEMDLVYVSMLQHEACAAQRAVGRHKPVVLRAEEAGRRGDCLWQIEASGGRRIKDACIKASAFVAPTPAVQRELQAAGYPRDRIRHIHNGVHVPPPRTAESRSAARAVLADAHAAFQLSEWATLGLYLGGVEQGRGLEQLLTAWRPVVQRWPNTRLWLAGEAPDKAALNRHIEMLGLTGRVMPIGVFDEVDALLAAADLLVAPSPEGDPGAILEAMATGLPVVAADVPANEGLLVHEQTGLAVPRLDSAALWSAVSRLIEDPGLAARLAAAARRRVERDFSLARMVEEHLSLFDRLTP